MSTRDIAAQILNRLTEEQLKGFIALFHDILPTKEDNSAKREEAFDRLDKMRRNIPDLDEKKELEEYRRERYDI
mgnify:FL=1|jgi:hypothetical protein